MKKYLLLLFAGLTLLVSKPVAEVQKEKWAGIDETVIERYATDKGREAGASLFNVEGDMLLFLFALAGAAGGFIMGYYWHKVFVVDKPPRENNL